MKNYLQDIASKWTDSLQILLPKNLKQLVQLTLKTWIELCGTLLRGFWWLLLAGALIFFVRPHWITLVLIVIVWLLLLILLVRPSLEQKDLNYLGDYAFYCSPLILLFLIPCCIPWIGLNLFAPYYFLAMFFICDAPLQPWALLMAPVHAARMAWNKLPIYLIFFCFFYLASWLNPFLNLLLAYPLILSALSRCYIMWLHKNYQEYHESTH